MIIRIIPLEAQSLAKKATVNCHLSHLKRLLETTAVQIADAGGSTIEDTDVCLLEHLEMDVTEHKRELSTVSRELFALDLEEHDELLELQLRLETSISETTLKLRRLLHSKSKHEANQPSRKPGVKLPKIDVPKFNGDILKCQTFWE